MDIYKIAMEMGKDSQSLYQDLSNKAPNSSIQGALKELIIMQEHHYQNFKDMAEDSAPVDIKGLTVCTISALLKDIPEYFELEANYTDELMLYTNALSIERASEAVYAKFAAGATNEKVKAQILSIVEEEHRHVEALEQVIDFIQAPAQHPVNAEFNVSEDY